MMIRGSGLLFWATLYIDKKRTNRTRCNFFRFSRV